MAEQLLNRIESQRSVVGIIGMGYVGLPLALRLVEAGYQVLGIDVNEEFVRKLNNAESYIAHIPSSDLQEAKSKGFSATTDYSKINEVDAILICVPTPLNKFREPDLTYVIQTTETFIPHLKAGTMIALESTTYPGTTEEEILTRVEAAGFKAGEDIFLVYSPEREDPGNPDFKTQTIPKVVGGYSENCKKVGVAFYAHVVDQVVPVSSLKAAEMTKLLENIHRAVNIGLVNEMKIVADEMGVDVYEVIDAAKTKPFGFTAYYPGPGLGGHCIPIDPFYLTWKAREYGVHTRFIELAGEINTSMPDYVVQKLAHSLNDRGKAVKGSKVLVLGLAYKKNVDDTRESPSFELIEKFSHLGADVSYSDPFVPVVPPKREYNFDLKSVELTPKIVNMFDAIVVSTNHDDFDYQMIRENAQLVIDARGVYRELADNIVRA